MNPLQDAFISYGRADSKHFAKALNKRLVELGYTIWFDFEDIPLGVDYQKQIDDGIEKADNFLFIIAPHSVNSPYCQLEIERALQCNKRIIPLLHVEQISRETWQQRNPGGTDEQWAEYQAAGKHSSFPNLHSEISKINWVYFREGLDNFKTSFAGLVELLERYKDYVHQHTVLLNRALTWERNQKQTRYLLIGSDREQAQNWLATRFTESQPPCLPTDLQCEFITESIKNANNLMTQVFLCHADDDRESAEKIRRSLLRQGITVWNYRTDIQTSQDYHTAIAQGIEAADNVLFMLSPHSIQSPYCQRELAQALTLHKRIIPILTAPIDVDKLPESLRSLQQIDLTDNIEASDYLADESQLLKILNTDTAYYTEHKTWLTQALKWERQHQNPTILLRGYNLRRAEDWLKGAKLRNQHPPTQLQETFISESLRHPPAASLDVFISYSRTDSELARRLNDELQIRGKSTWFDQESIASGTDFQQEIYRGIERANNFLFILSPQSVNSPYCAGEVEYAARLNKRFVTLLHHPIDTANLHLELAKIQWIDFTPTGGDFFAQVNQLIRTLETDREYVHSHTKWSLRALEWNDKDRNEDLLLRGSERVAAAAWLESAIATQNSPTPTQLQRAFIQASTELHERTQRQEQARQQRELELAIKAKKAAQRTVVGAIAFAVFATGLAIFAYRQQQLAKQQAAIAQIREQASRVSDWLPTFKAAEGLVLAIDTYNRGKSLHSNNQSLAQSLQTLAASTLFEALQITPEINRLQGPSGVTTVAVNPDGQSIISKYYDGTVRIWDADTGQLVSTADRLDANSQSLVKLLDSRSSSNEAYSPDGKRKVIADGTTLTILDTSTGQPTTLPLKGYTDWVTSVAFSPDGQHIVSGSIDHTLQIWDANTQQAVGAPLRGHTDQVLAVAYSPDGQYIISGSADTTVRVWDAKTRNPVGSPLRGHTDKVTSVASSPDNHIISGSVDRTIRIWDLPIELGIGQLLKEPETQANSTPKDQFDYLQSYTHPVAFSSDSQRMVSGRLDGTLQLWDVKTGQPIGQPLQGHSGEILSVAFGPNGQSIVSSSADQTMRMWKANTGQPIGQFPKIHTGAVNSVAFSPDGRYIISGSSDKTLRIWDATTLQPIGQPLQGHGESVNSVAFSSDGQRVVSGSVDQTVRIWDAITWQPISKPLQGHSVQVTSVAFSPDGQHVVSGSGDKTLRIWDVNTGRSVGLLRGHTAYVWSVAYSPDGQFIVSSSWDKTLRLWNARTGQPIGQPLEGHIGQVTSVAFSPDGRYIVSGSNDNTLRLWAASSDEWLTLACQRLRNHPLLNQPENIITDEPEFLKVAQRARSVCGKS